MSADLDVRESRLPADTIPFTIGRRQFVSARPEGSSVNLQGEISSCGRAGRSQGSFSIRQPIQRGNRLPASFRLGTYVPWSVG